MAPSEIGANRKHRGNRLLTVIQYAMDMLQGLGEMRRLLRPNGSALITIGRESNVRGTSFRNGYILAMIAVGGAGFRLARWQERVFTNRFGARIYEDLLTLVPDPRAGRADVEFGREVGCWALNEALGRALKDVVPDLEDALSRSDTVEPSPLLPDPGGLQRDLDGR